jgi:hypothetical protein
MPDNATKATPRPWHCDGHGNDWEIFSSADWPIARLNAKIQAGAQANGALIVQAVNAHDELVALLEELIDIEGPQPGTAAWAAKVRAALARARE